MIEFFEADAHRIYQVSLRFSEEMIEREVFLPLINAIGEGKRALVWEGYDIGWYYPPITWR